MTPSKPASPAASAPSRRLVDPHRQRHALDAVEAAIVVLENDPIFDAGYGSHLNLDGRVECDAIVMDGATLRAGSVAAVQRIRNPIRLARKLYEVGPHMMLVAEGAEQFAKENGIALCNPKELIAPAEREAWQQCKKDQHAAEHHRGHEQGTVGAVALDSHGRCSPPLAPVAPAANSPAASATPR